MQDDGENVVSDHATGGQNMRVGGSTGLPGVELGEEGRRR
jgi:hypothetical protein